MRHIDDAEAPGAARLAAVDALGKIGTTHSREILHRLSRRTDGIGSPRNASSRKAPRRHLSERELEVLDLARHGLTNKDIAERLSLSRHTIGHHLANARAKLGAANRAEAAAMFEEMKVYQMATAATTSHGDIDLWAPVAREACRNARRRNAANAMANRAHPARYRHGRDHD